MIVRKAKVHTREERVTNIVKGGGRHSVVTVATYSDTPVMFARGYLAQLIEQGLVVQEGEFYQWVGSSVDEYQKDAGRTRNTGALSQADELSNYALGLVGECFELAAERRAWLAAHPQEAAAYLEKLVSEAGDCWWYLANLCTITGLALRDVVAAADVLRDEQTTTLAANMPPELGQVAEAVKKRLYHGRALDAAALVPALAAVAAWLLHGEPLTGRETVWQRNVDKLRERWPDGFVMASE